MEESTAGHLWPKISGEMYCGDCEDFFKTDDYYNCKKCEKCQSLNVMRTSSTAFAYSYLAKHPVTRTTKETK